MARCASARPPRRYGDRRLSWLDAPATLEERDAGERGRLVHQIFVCSAPSIARHPARSGGAGRALADPTVTQSDQRHPQKERALPPFGAGDGSSLITGYVTPIRSAYALASSGSAMGAMPLPQGLPRTGG